MTQRDVQNLARRRWRGRRASATTRSTSFPGWSSSTRSTRSRRRRRPIWPCAGTARPASADRARPKINGNPKLMCMTRLNDAAARMSRSPSSRCRRFRCIKDLVTDVSWNFAGQEDDHAVQAAPARRAGRHVADARRRTSIACRSSASASSASCARTSATSCATTSCTIEFIGPRFLTYAAALEMNPLDVGRPGGSAQGSARHRLLQHHALLHEGLPRAHHDHGERDHPAQGARRRSLLRSGHETAAGVSHVR